MEPEYPKGIRVLSKDYPEMFERILGYDEYCEKIKATEGNPLALREVFWKDLGDDYHWEFIEGEIVLRAGSTVFGAQVGQNLFTALWRFVAGTDNGRVLSSRCVCSFPNNDFSPYMMYYPQKMAVTFERHQNRFPIPDWIIEINDENTEENNRGIKFQDYEKYRVKEYCMLNLKDRSIEQYVLEGSILDFKGKFFEGNLESQTLENFKIDLKEIFEQA